MIDPRLCIADMVRSMEAVGEFTAGMDYRSFAADDKTASAVVRKLEQIGEAAKAMPDPYRKRFPSVPWRDLEGLRDRLIHFYFGVHYRLVWQTATSAIPRLLPEVKSVRDALRKDSGSGRRER